MSKLLKKNAFTNFDPWVGFDLDSTLAMGLDDYSDPTVIGEPVPAMVELAKRYLASGMTVKVFTARVSDKARAGEIKAAIRAWTLKHIGTELESTCEKDPGLQEYFDDKAVGVTPDTGAVKTASMKGWMSPKGEVHWFRGQHAYEIPFEIYRQVEDEMKKKFPKKKRNLEWEEKWAAVAIAQGMGYARMGQEGSRYVYIHYDKDAPGGKEAALHALQYLKPKLGMEIRIETKPGTQSLWENNHVFDSPGLAAQFIRTGELPAKTAKTAKTRFNHDNLPSWEEFVQYHGGPEGLQKILNLSDYYAERITSAFEDDTEGMSDEERDEFLTNVVMNETRNRYQSIVSFFDGLNFPLEVYREITVPSLDSIKFDSIGVYWTWDENAAEAHWGQGSGRYVKFAAEINADIVDWDTSIMCNLDPSLGEEEKELRLFDGASFELLGYGVRDGYRKRDEEWVPMQRRVTAKLSAKELIVRRTKKAAKLAAKKAASPIGSPVPVTETPAFKAWFGASRVCR